MSDAANEIILHNYPQSPVAEKVRAGSGHQRPCVEICRNSPAATKANVNQAEWRLSTDAGDADRS